MKSFELLEKKQKIIVIGILVLSLIIIIYYFYTQYHQLQKEDFQQEEIEEANIMQKEEIEAEEAIIIHISGAVEKEGIVKVKEGARISDVIEVAGGLKLEASLKNVNLAYMVEDGQKIYIPTKEEEKEQEEKEYTIIQDGNNNDSTTKKEEGKGKVNINQATQTELEGLPGIGSSTALKIIQYREENGKFQSIEDIKQVNGIGDAKYNQIKDGISV